MEELAKIAEIIGGLGEQGKTAFIAYLLVDLVKSLTWAAVAGFAFYAVFKRVGQAVLNTSKRNA